MTIALFGRHRLKSHSSLAILAFMLLGANCALAQSSDTGTEQVVVTGSRVVRDGYNAPTPVTVLGAELLDQMANTNIADSLYALPQFSTNVTQSSQVGGFSGGSVGVNTANLRGLGAQRTLILVDGKRLVNTSLNTQFAAPDINTIPNAIVSRLDVVTGGASAAYGSDALTGVVNFVLDHDFTGIKGKIQGGITTYGDNAQNTMSVTAGTGFGPGDRGHLILSLESSHNDGVRHNYRPWESGGGSVFTNPAWTATNGLPFYIAGTNVGLSNATPGGLITRGPLKGTSFGPGGTPTQFTYGLVSADNVMQGGDWQASRLDNVGDLVASDTRQVAYGRASYDVTDNFQVYAELQWASSNDRDLSLPNTIRDAVTVRSDNPFIPTAVATQLAASGQTSFVLGTENGDVDSAYIYNTRVVNRWTVGASGHFDAFGSIWNWDGYVQDSANAINQRILNNVNKTRFNQAVDAVRSPTSGSIVCRSTLASPGDGCVPYDAMGNGVNSRAAINYVTGTSSLHQTLSQGVGALNLHGEPLSTWAGPVSLAVGIEHRIESTNGLESPGDTANVYVFGNYHGTVGHYTVTEGYVEAVVPLANNLSWAKSLDIDGTIRATGYSTSGEVTTSKLGLNYTPVDDFKIRVTHSRDIRAPNLGELYGPAQSSGNISVNDPFTGGSTTPAAVAQGNINLKPEVANQTGGGIVVTPSFLPGFQASIDYYNIDITGAIALPSGQSIVNLCFQGNQQACGLVTRTAGAITQIRTSFLNVASQNAEGVDFDASYRFSLADIYDGWGGDIAIRALGTYVSSLNQINTSGTIQGAGVTGYYAQSMSFSNIPPMAPKWRHDLFVSYTTDPFSATLTWHYIAPAVYNKAFASCTTGCPVGSQNSISNNNIGSNSTFDLALTYKPFENNKANLFLTIDNITNQYPPFVAGNIGFTYAVGQYNYSYDRIGRSYLAGFRFEL